MAATYAPSGTPEVVGCGGAPAVLSLSMGVTDTVRATALDSVLTLAAERLVEPELSRVVGLIPRFYATADGADLAERTARDLLGAVVHAVRLADGREPGTAAVSVVNPDVATDGWQSDHTVVQVVTDDMPFIVDSVRMALSAQELGIHWVVDPVLVREDAGGRHESWLMVEADRCGQEQRDELAARLAEVLDDVRAAVGDWDAMRAKAAAVADLLDASQHGHVDDTERAQVFLRWLADGNFTFLGYRQYEVTPGPDGAPVLSAVEGTGMGLMRDGRRTRDPLRVTDLTPEARALLAERTTLMVTVANSRSTVHRNEYLNYVGVKCFDEAGEVVSEHRFVGLYPELARLMSVLEIPILREKCQAVLDRAGHPSDSHLGRHLRLILEEYPRDELFQISEDELYVIATGILNLQDRRQVRLFARRDDFGRFVSCLVYLPRDRFSSVRVEQIVGALTTELGGIGSEHEAAVGDTTLARLHVRVHIPPDASREVDLGALEHRLGAICSDWLDGFRSALVAAQGEDRGLALFRELRHAFPDAYRDTHDPHLAVADVERLEAVVAGEDLVTGLERPLGAMPGEVRLVVMRSGPPMTLSEILPFLEHLGVTVVDEQAHELRLRSGGSVWRYAIGLRVAQPERLRHADLTAEFQAAFVDLVAGRTEPDGLNALILAAGLTRRQVEIVRAYARYLRQIGLPFTRSYVEQTLTTHGTITAKLTDLFAARFDPALDVQRSLWEAGIRQEVLQALDSVPNLDEDRIVRAVMVLIDATVRTNAYRPADDVAGGPARPVLSFKLDPSRVPDLPKPRPFAEIWVYGRRVEGVHLRGGPVARGGIRWSDRRDDFRTEVLGLVKAQMVKNAVIVPGGAKGGFVVGRQQQLTDPVELRAEAQECYRLFIAGLLDVTDNVVDGAVKPPPFVVRHDGDDPYLVVAADKGTATFSDLANEVAVGHGFWLGDAFASGGSAGYDHKAMGITARGAWESVKRHGSSLGIDVATDPFTVVGIGDMSGDVFGNGMLLSPAIRLLAAFDHRHVFVDPDPDPEVSLRERQRLFALARSSWDDYDRSLLSPGGGVYPRQAKTVALSEEARARFGVEEASLTPNELIRHLLRGPVDLLWNGGIGTFVKASTESHADVGDRTNDAIRVDATELRCRMVGEGGNLGFTQRARVEYALEGGRIFTDAIDNSAGVDCSDHEVNIKILLDQLVRAGELTEERRNELLREMTDEVAELVLDDNRAQTLALTIAREQAFPMVDVHARYLRQLEVEGLIDRALEFLPGDKELQERAAAGRGLTTPEMAVLLAYTKNTCVQEVLASDVPDDPYLDVWLVDYFPTPLHERFVGAMRSHRLRREIVATRTVNTMVNRSGISFDHRMTEETGATVPDILRAHLAACEVFEIDRWWAAVEALGSSVAGETQVELFLVLRRMIERSVLWLLRHRRPPLSIAATVASFRGPIGELTAVMPELVAGGMGQAVSAAIDRYGASAVPSELARMAAVWPLAHTAFDVVEEAMSFGRGAPELASVYWTAFDALDGLWLWERIGALPRTDRWTSQARGALRDDFMGCLRALASDVARFAPYEAPADAAAAWLEANARAVQRAQAIFSEIRTGGVFDFATLSVAIRQLRNLVLTTSVG
jgi:glutamate dehydrogenase